MKAGADQVVSIRVPKGLPEELKALTGMKFSTLARATLVALLNNERRRIATASATLQQTQESTNDQYPGSPNA